MSAELSLNPPAFSLTSYLESRNIDIESRKEFFYLLQMQLFIRNSVRRPELSDAQFSRLITARSPFAEDEWKYHYARGVALLPASEANCRPFDFWVEQIGSILTVKITTTDALGLWSVKDHLKDVPHLFLSEVSTGFEDPYLAMLSANISAENLYSSPQSMELALYLIDLLFEYAVLYCSNSLTE